MTGRLKSEKGFSTIEVLFILVIVVAIGFVGWHVYISNSSTLKSDNKSPRTTKVSSSASHGYFVIKEWGLRAKYSSSLILNYTIPKNNTITNDHGHSYQYLYLSSDQLDGSSGNCADGTYGGALEKYGANDEFLQGDGDVDSGMTAAQYASTLSSSEYGHVGSFYYFLQSPQALCGQSRSSWNIQGQTQTAFQDLLSHLEAIPSAQ